MVLVAFHFIDQLSLIFTWSKAGEESYFNMVPDGS